MTHDRAATACRELTQQSLTSTDRAFVQNAMRAAGETPGSAARAVLAPIVSQNAWDFINGNDECWIGAQRQGTHGNFVWNSGSDPASMYDGDVMWSVSGTQPAAYSFIQWSTNRPLVGDAFQTLTPHPFTVMVLSGTALGDVVESHTADCAYCFVPACTAMVTDCHAEGTESYGGIYPTCSCVCKATHSGSRCDTEVPDLPPFEAPTRCTIGPDHQQVTSFDGSSRRLFGAHDEMDATPEGIVSGEAVKDMALPQGWFNYYETVLAEGREVTPPEVELRYRSGEYAYLDQLPAQPTYRGLQRSGSMRLSVRKQGGRFVVTVPSIPGYATEITEVLEIVFLPELAGVCAPAVTLLRIRVMKPVMSSERSMGTFVKVVSGASALLGSTAMTDTQAVPASSLMGCANPKLRDVFGSWHALSPLVLGQTAVGVMGGSILLTIIVLIVQVVCVVAHRVYLKVKKESEEVTLLESCARVLCVSLTLLVMAGLNFGFAFASVRIVRIGSAGFNGGEVAQGVMGIIYSYFVVGVFLFLVFPFLFVSRLYHTNDYTFLAERIPKFVIVVFCPWGSIFPVMTRQILYPMISVVRFRLFLWTFFVMVPSIMFGILSGFDEMGCVGVFACMCVLHFVLAIVVGVMRPFRTLFDNVLAVVSFALLGIYFALCAGLAVFPDATEQLIDGAMGIAVVVALVDLIRIVWQVLLLLLEDRMIVTAGRGKARELWAADSRFDLFGVDEMRRKASPMDIGATGEKHAPVFHALRDGSYSGIGMRASRGSGDGRRPLLEDGHDDDATELYSILHDNKRGGHAGGDTDFMKEDARVKIVDDKQGDRWNDDEENDMDDEYAEEEEEVEEVEEDEEGGDADEAASGGTKEGPRDPEAQEADGEHAEGEKDHKAAQEQNEEGEEVDEDEASEEAEEVAAADNDAENDQGGSNDEAGDTRPSADEPAAEETHDEAEAAGSGRAAGETDDAIADEGAAASTVNIDHNGGGTEHHESEQRQRKSL